MSKELIPNDKSGVKQVKSVDEALNKQRPVGSQSGAAQLLNLQRQVGNQAVQRFLAQRSDDGGFELDDETAGRINQARGGGQSLDEGVQRQMSEAMNFDFSGVRVHTSPEADTLNQQLNAKAFTTGQDVFFKQDEYNPGSSSGQELIAHELTHVVQQSSGLASSGSGMRVNPPGDMYEQEADAMAKQAINPGGESSAAEAGVQRQMPEEELMTKRDEAQRQEAESLEEEEEEVMAKRDEVQRQEAESLEEEEEEVMAKRDDVQRHADRDELAA